MYNIIKLGILFLICMAVISLIDRRIVLGWKMHKIDRATGPQFEKYLCCLFRQMGYRVRHTGKTGDYGADLVLYGKRHGKQPREKIVVQAKRYRQPVGQEAVREAVAAVAYYRADRAAVVTNSRFTTAARNLARSNHVMLYDRDWLYSAVKKQKPGMDAESGDGEDCIVVDIDYRRKVKVPAAEADAGHIGHALDECLEDAGYTVIR